MNFNWAAAGKNNCRLPANLIDVDQPLPVADTFEMVVGVMLVVLGVRAVVRSAWIMRAGQDHRHAHRGQEHVHAGTHAHVHVAGRAFATRALVVGMVHGLAGSGALVAMVLVKLPSTSARVSYIALFAVGSIAGMALLSGAVGVPLARLSRRARHARRGALLVSRYAT